MLGSYALPLLVALLQPAPPMPNPAPPTPVPLVTPSPAPPPSAAPAPAGPVPSATPLPPPTSSPSPQPTANPFGYVVAPPATTGANEPRIVEIALNDKTLHQGGQLLVRITTTTDVTSVVARTLGREIGIPEASPGIFAGVQQLPTGIPFFLLNRSYQVSFVASTADGRSATYTLPIRLER